MPRTSPYAIDLTDDECRTLQSVARRHTSPYRDVLRATIVLLAARGLRNDQIAARLDTPRQVVDEPAGPEGEPEPKVVPREQVHVTGRLGLVILVGISMACSDDLEGAWAS